MGSFLGISSVNCFAWATYKGFFAGAFSVPSVARLFPRAFFRNGGIHGLIFSSFIRALLWSGFLRALSPRSFFVRLLSALFRAVSGRSILLAPYRRRFCLALLCRASFPRLLSQSFFGTLFCRAFPMGYSPVHLPCELPHGRFPWTLSRGRLQCSLWGWIFGSIFSGSFSVQFFAGETSMGAFAGGFFCALFRKGFVCAILCRNFLPALFGRVFLHSLMWSFYPALFCKGDIHKLLRGGYFRTIISSASFRAVYR